MLQENETRSREEHQAMWDRMPITRFGIMMQTVAVIGTDIELEMGDIVLLEPATNLPQGGVFAQSYDETQRHAPAHLNYCEVMPVTAQQVRTYLERVDRLGNARDVHPLIAEREVLVVRFQVITLVIEPDGHAHS